uniref:Na(+)/H(+) exchange regulatory cofactor NHE-RF1-like n=1 Tax=Dermatophagoides pteronyssinus TaxID=6956 RepID=A0A6P6XPZ5_DERPT|nr:Na(+)/H(+) exchange regulatory cofactor NHE-RF1-like [Dermatophagoides pteronyssinus]
MDYNGSMGDGNNINNGDYIDAPCPRLCHLIKWPDFNGYGFNLHAEKTKQGQYIGKVDDDSPAMLAGLREGDKIIEVNFVNICNENHRQVVERIKSITNETRLLVIDDYGDRWYRERKLIIKSTQSNVICYRTPIPRPLQQGILPLPLSSSDPMIQIRQPSSLINQQQQQQAVKNELNRRKSSSASSSTTSSTTTSSSKQDNNTGLNNNNNNPQQKIDNNNRTASITSSIDSSASASSSSSLSLSSSTSSSKNNNNNRNNINGSPISNNSESNLNNNNNEIDEKKLQSNGTTTKRIVSNDNNGGGNVSSGNGGNSTELNLNMTAAEMRQLIAQRKKQDIKKTQIDLKKKYEIIQQM